MIKFKELNTNRFVLRQFKDEDIENVFKGLSHPDVIKYYGISFETIEATQEQMDWFANNEKNGTGIWWAIYGKDDNVFYGAGGLNDIIKEHRKAEVGFWLLKEFWGKGIMIEVMPKIIEFGFEQLALNRIEGFVDSENQNCKKALSKLNFNYEGCMRDCEVKNGNYISLDIYAILKKSYR